MSRSEFCIVNRLDANRVEIERQNNKAKRTLSTLRDYLIEKLSDADLEGCEDWLDELDGYSDEIESACDDLNEMVDEADDFARENLDAKYEEGRDEGYDSGYNDGCEQSECVDDCIEHYEELLWGQFEEFYGKGDVVDYHVKARELTEFLAEERYER